MSLSSYFSPRVLRLRRALEAGAIERDLGCTRCGYNLRGLTYGRACPECGETIRLDDAGDALTEGGAEERSRKLLALRLALGAIAALALLRVGYFVLGIVFLPPILQRGYTIACALNAIAWVVATWMIATPAIAERRRWARLAVGVARWGSLAWLPVYALLLIRDFSPAAALATHDLLRGGAILLRLPAGAAAVAFIALLRVLAEDSDLDDAARRLNSAAWLVAFPTVILVLLPRSITWIAAILVFLVLVAWTWAMIVLLLALVQMESHVRWSSRIAAEAHDREGRIAERRREFDRAVRGRIRSLPASGGDVGLDEAER